MNSKSQKGFTLVEIMIVVVIVGLLAAMAIPAFQRVRANSINSAMDNDARQLASAAQQYFLETGNNLVTIGYIAATGEITGPLQQYVQRIGRRYTGINPLTFNATTPNFTFTISHALVPARTYSAEGVFISIP